MCGSTLDKNKDGHPQRESRENGTDSDTLL